MGKYVKTFDEFITEAAEWDDTTKRYIDKYFVSFDDKEKYELAPVLKAVMRRLKNEDISEEDILKTMNDCKNKIPRNNPRKQLIKCVLAKYGIEITD